MVDKETLRSYGSTKQEIEQIGERIERLKSNIMSPGVQKISGMPVYHSEDHDRMADYMAKAETLQDRYNRKMADLLETERKIEDAKV